MSEYVWYATAAVALAALAVLGARRRFATIAAALTVCVLLLLVRGPDVGFVAPFVLIYLALLIAIQRAAPLLHGAAATIVVALAALADENRIDWSAEAERRFDVQDYVAANDAYSRAYEASPGDLQLLENYAVTQWTLQQHVRAVALLDEALKIARRSFLQADEALRADPKNPTCAVELGRTAGDYARILRNRASWMSFAGAPEQALAEFDRAMQHPHLEKHGTLVFASAELRLDSVRQLLDELTTELELHHPDRVSVVPLLTDHLRAATADSNARRKLVDGLVSARMREDVDHKLRRAWELIQQADAVLGDIRTSEMNRILPARLVRAEIDYRLGRFLRAKEEIQCLLSTPQAPAERKRALGLIAQIALEAGSPYECSLWRKEIIVANGGEDIAPLHLIADYYEALFRAAENNPDTRVLFVAAADKHLAKKGRDGRRYDETDLRTVGFRGVAALRFENDPTNALKHLRIVFEALRVNRSRDPSILRPERAKLFVEAMLEATARSNRETDRSEGLSFANSLLEVSATDPELRKRRATLLESAGRYAEAAEDLKIALRYSKLDYDLFERWISVAEKSKDASGRTPKQVAEGAAERAERKLEELRAELDRDTGYHSTHKLRQSGQYLTRAFAEIFEFESSLAGDPLVAWHMSREFGRLGAVDEARNFLFKAVTTEPEILPFRMHLGELRLDLGLFDDAIDDFRQILARDPSNMDVALRVYQALLLKGDVAAARDLRAETMMQAPVETAIEFAVRSELENGRVDRAVETIGSHLGTQDPHLAGVVGMVRLADGKVEPALESLKFALGSRPDSAELYRHYLLALARGRSDAELLATADTFTRLPRLLPSTEILALMAELVALDKPAAAAYIGDGVAKRYTGAAGIAIESHAILANLRAGNASPLRSLLDDPRNAKDYPDDVVRACFGLALRERGPAAAATFLQTAREYSAERDAATLPIAAAFALTPHTLDVSTFLGRYERRYTEAQIPVADQILWMLTRQRASAVGVAPPTAPGAEGELAWIESSGPSAKVGDSALADVYLRFLLFRYAGDGFENDARTLAESIVTAHRNALCAARFVAAEIERTESAAPATAYLLDKYQTSPTDRLTFLQLGDLLTRSDPNGATLGDLATEGKKLFPGQREPLLFAARAATLRKDFPAAEADLATLLSANRSDGEALAAMCQLGAAANVPDLSARIVAHIQASGSESPAILQFLLAYCSAPGADANSIVTTIGPLLAIQPRFYSGIGLLAGALAERKDSASLESLAKKLLDVARNDPAASEHGEAFHDVCQALITAGNRDLALEVANLGIAIAPAHVELRRRRVELLSVMNGEASVIEDLEVLCVLAPRVSDLLFTLSDLMLSRRGDKLDVVLSLFPTLAQLAPDDSRRSFMLAKVRFLRTRHNPSDQSVTTELQLRKGLELAKTDMATALRAAEGRQDYWFFAGIIAMLAGDHEYAKVALGRVTEGFRFYPRAQFLQETLLAAHP